MWCFCNLVLGQNSVQHKVLTTKRMAAADSARPLTWDSFSYDAPWPCADGCHEYYLYDDSEAKLDDDGIFTHVDDDDEILDQEYATIKQEILDTPNLTYKDFVDMVMTDDILNQMIIGTNEYGFDHDIDSYKPLSLDELGRCHMKLAIGSYILQKEHNLTIHELLQNSEEHGVKFLTDNLPQEWFRSIRHNMCFNEYKYLDDIEDAVRKCTDKFDFTLQELQKNSNSVIIMPNKSVLDEIRTNDNSRRSRFGTFIQNKPIKRGRTTDATAAKIQGRTGNIMDGLTIATNTNKGKKDSYDKSICRLINPAVKEGKTDNKVHQIVKWKSENGVRTNNGILAMDKGYNSVYATEKILERYGYKGVGPIKDGRKCLPKFFGTKRFKKLRKQLKKGEYKQWYTRDGSHLTLFHDSKFVNLFDRCIAQDKLAVIYRRRKKKLRGRSRRWRDRFIVPQVIAVYNDTMSSVDASNSRAKKHMIGTKHVRKHNRCYLGLLDRLVFQNSALQFAAYKGWKKCNQTDLRKSWCREVVQEYYRIQSDRGVANKRVPKPKKIDSLENTLMNRGIYPSNHVHKLVHIGPDRGRIKCFVHKKQKTYYKCDTCSILGQEFGFCHPNHGRIHRTCFADFKFHQNHAIQDA